MFTGHNVLYCDNTQLLVSLVCINNEINLFFSLIQYSSSTVYMYTLICTCTCTFVVLFYCYLVNRVSSLLWALIMYWLHVVVLLIYILVYSSIF